LGKISLKKCREPGLRRGLYQKKICLTPPGRDQADFVSTAINDYMVDPLPTGTCDLPD